MKIIFSIEIKKLLIDNINKSDDAEFAFLVLSKVCDNIIFVNQPYYICDRKYKDYLAFLPKIEQMKLLKICHQNNLTPTIIHSHVLRMKLEFSAQDTKFESAILHVSNEMGGGNGLLSILFRANEYIWRYWKADGNICENFIKTHIK